MRNLVLFSVFFLCLSPIKSQQKPSQAKSIAFRFSAMGLATEITFQNGVPL
jgi:hypothetical protein